MSASHTMRAWSCSVRLVVGERRVLPAAVADLRALLERVDHAVSRFRTDSALSIANARAGRPTPAPRLLVDLVGAALDGADRTGGLVDPTLGRAMVALGYDRDIAAVEADGPAVRASIPTADWHAVRLDRTVGLLTVPAGTALDLGATAKAFTADLAARTLSRRYGTAVLVELGGDIAVAGDRPDGWCIRVAEAEGGDGQLVQVRRGGVATSTTTVRRWRRGDTELHHIVDPRTGAPAAGTWRTATVAGESAYAANLATTAAIVLGDGAVPWLEDHHLPARLVARDGTVRTTTGWPAAHRAAVAA